ncbi:hypothetical protein BRPE67_ECDS02850 (plasmid) [Caballeronia cordobensis]|nr:hypothetical protein BRPE67_ECDS02850 [Burkholderia sp. RPE67]
MWRPLAFSFGKHNIENAGLVAVDDFLTGARGQVKMNSRKTLAEPGEDKRQLRLHQIFGNTEPQLRWSGRLPKLVHEVIVLREKTPSGNEHAFALWRQLQRPACALEDTYI